MCKEKNIYIEHQLKIDKKRKRDMHHDRLSESDPIDIMQLEETLDSTDDTTVDIRELKYGFFSLSYIKQTEILLSLGLLNENDRDKKYVKIMPRIIDSARQKNVLIGLWDRINNERTR